MPNIKNYAFMLGGLLLALIVLFFLLNMLGKVPGIGPFAQKIEGLAQGQ